MRIKKFTCYNCGAPKINEYTSPYIVCDFCGSFTDIDYTLGFQNWQSDFERKQKYETEKIVIENTLSNLVSQKRESVYKKLQLHYWDLYYKAFPEYLPPTIDTEEKYKTLLEIAASSSTRDAFDPQSQHLSAESISMQSKLKYYYKDNRAYVEPESFFKLAEFYMNVLRSSFKDFYNNPEYSLMNDFLPEDVHLKMKISSFVQIWLPYLEEEHANRFLKMTGFNQQYVELTKPPGENINCPHCSTQLYIPQGSYKLYCESCHKIVQVRNSFKCMSCGADNHVPENPGKPVNCEYCETENRLIEPLFG